MGQGGMITLVNGTSYDWTNTHHPSYQMNSWSFPDTILAGQATSIFVEWDQGILITQSDDAGEVNCRHNGTSLKFQVQARANEDFNLRVAFPRLTTIRDKVAGWPVIWTATQP